MEHLIGRISFGNTRAGEAIRTLKDEIIDKHMWEEECRKKDEEIERLKAIIADLQKGIRKRHGVQKSR